MVFGAAGLDGFALGLTVGFAGDVGFAEGVTEKALKFVA